VCCAMMKRLQCMLGQLLCNVGTVTDNKLSVIFET